MRHHLRNLTLSAVACALAYPYGAYGDAAACSVTATSIGQTITNPPTGEDADFFVNSGGIPSVMFLLGTARSMVRLPPDGASQGWGSFEKPNNNVEGQGYGCWNEYGNALVFHSSCGQTTVESKPYNQGPAGGWAEAQVSPGKYCPHMVSGNQPMATNKAGFDPDFYPSFFTKDAVFRDATAGLVLGDGWTGGTTTQTAATAATYCNGFAADPAKKTSCDTCMASNGYFFDGTYAALPVTLSTTCRTTADCQKYGYGTCVKDGSGVEHRNENNDNAHCKVPNVYFTGNFLNFYPPKFILARKVLKDVLASVRKMRLGLAVLNNAAGTSAGARLVESLGPTCAKIGTPSSWDASRGSIKNAINNATNVAFTDPGKPLAEALLDVGQLYHIKTAPWFGATYQDSAFDEPNSAGDKSVCWTCQASSVLLIGDGAPTGDAQIPGSDVGPGMTKAVADAAGNLAGMTGYGVANISAGECPICDTSAGKPQAADTTIANGTCAGQQASGACDALGNPIPSYLPKVAWYLKNMDFRPSSESGADGPKMTGKQSVTTYTIGFGTRGAASSILENTAEAGGGLYNGGSGTEVVDARTLRDAILRTLEDVSTRSISFGAASLSTLQASATQSVLIPRFEPSRSALWDGHLYAFDLYSEFSGGCSIPTAGASGPANGDYDCDGFCTSVFLKDADGAFIQEDGTGAFKKNLNTSLAACGFGTMCPVGKCSAAGTVDAKPKWDVGARLASVLKDASGVEQPNPDHKAWTARKLYTVTDSTGDGKFTSADTLVEIAGTVTDAVADTLTPYLNIRQSRFCNDLAMRLAYAGNPDGARIDTELATGKYTTCAKVIIQYAKGADVFNEKAAATFPATPATRKYQLGDVFHSSPVEVWPPLPSDGWVCSAGLHPQCLSSIYETGVPAPSVDGNANAYDDFAKSDRYKHRQKLTLVGANDGMLHAFTSGVWRGGADDNRTTPDESRFPYEGFHEDRASAGAAFKAALGDEVWAFIPPDLLPKIRMLMDKTHQFYVDATPMVRDVWIDGGVANGLGGTANANGARERNEFKTVAVVGERRGGNKYFALDVTDATGDLDAKPRFMWIYPQPNDPESLQFGETYAEFVPKPPPIGPVRIDAGLAPCTANRQEFLASTGQTRCFEEKWVALLSGGFDPLMTRGRGVHMVDLGTGNELWDFSQPPGAASACTAGGDPRCKLNYPVAATVGMMMWGTQAAFPESSVAGSHNRYFDTATFGDTGGQLWVLRFSDPGVIDPATKKVNNWLGARIFQHSKSTAAAGCGLNYCYGQPFFYITSNLPIAKSKKFRVLAGTGDRFNLLDPVGGQCGPENLRACVMKGCTVTLGDGASGAGARYGITPLLGEQTYTMDHAASCGSTPAYESAVTASTGASCTTVTHKVEKLTISCPATVTCSTLAESSTRQMAITCNGADATGSCTASTTNDPGLPIDLKGNKDVLNWFFSILVFEETAPRALFDTPAEAIAYDQARLSEADLVSINEYDQDVADGGTMTKPLADADGKGWKYHFDHGEPSAKSPWTTTISGATWNVYRTDERTASVSTVEAGCTFWNTMQTAISPDAYNAGTECPINGKCKAGRAQVSYLYGANPGTGAACMRIDDATQRVQKNETLVPPHIGKLVAYVNSGQVSFGLTTVRIPQGGANVALGEVQDIASQVGWIPLDEKLHQCRHGDKDAPAPADAVCKE